MLVMMSEDMEVSCTETNGETNHHHCTSGSPGRGVQMSEANLGSNNLSIISAACVATSVQQKEILIIISSPAQIDKQEVRFHMLRSLCLILPCIRSPRDQD